MLWFMKYILIALLIFRGAAGRAEIPAGALRPKQIVTEIPQTAWDTLKYSFQRDSVPVWAGLIASTAVLYQYDADLYDWSMRQGRRWNLKSEDLTKTIISLGPDAPILRLPSDAGSALYFLGDGWTHFSIAGGFLASGYFGTHARAWNTGVQIVHGITVSTMFNQFLKRTTGRQSPNHRTSPRGMWRPFPNQMKYSHNTPSYDAFPSGHVMTATLVFNTIRANYPAQEYWLFPVQAAWTTALMFQMMNNGVHWVSDYPLGIAMGWVVAKMAHRMGHGDEPATAKATAWNAWSVAPGVGPAGEPIVNAMRSF